MLLGNKQGNKKESAMFIELVSQRRTVLCQCRISSGAWKAPLNRSNNKDKRAGNDYGTVD